LSIKSCRTRDSITGGCRIDINNIDIDRKIKDFRILITGIAGFIGSNLLEFFLRKGFYVKGIDNFETGSQKNIDDVINRLKKRNINTRFDIIKGDIRSFSDCIETTKEIDIVFHEAALGSVQRSIDKPIDSNNTNVTGTLNMLKASIDNDVKRFVYASSSSVYGDSKILPKSEEMPVNPKSIYAVSKAASEFYVRLFYNIYGLETISLRYFNVFGKRQSPDSIYSAVIPIFIKRVRDGEPVTIFGDGEQNRDFTFIDNVVYANYLAMISENKEAYGNFYNVGCGDRISLNEIIDFLEKKFKRKIDVINKGARKGDVRSSLASLGKIQRDLGYKPLTYFYNGLEKMI
jgi:UDP-N-acetylglucosamine/UDP-N-acetylgalactosamine 4-epimerase